MSDIQKKQVKLVAKLKKILDNDLDNALQGNYDERNAILSEFEDLIDQIENYRND